MPGKYTYVIVCIDRTKKSDTLIFWKRNRAGYTNDLTMAGRYSDLESAEICGRDSNQGVKHLRFKTIAIDRDSFGFFSIVEAASKQTSNH